MKKLALALALSTFATPVLADVAAVGLTGTGSSLGNPPFTMGFQFSTSVTFNVTGLGVFDSGGDGLVEAHEVGLWDAQGTLLASTTIGAGLSGTLVSGSRFASISPVLITPGVYRVGAVFTSGLDPSFFGGDGVLTPATGVTYIAGAYHEGSTLADPIELGNGAPAYIGGNLLLGAVPEPASWAMMIGGFALLGGVMRRQKVALRFA